MRLALAPHPLALPAPVSVEAEARRAVGGRLNLAFVISGDLDALAIPAPGAPARADGLWQHTCLEAFVGVPTYLGYWEFNFAPSSQWAAYRFSDYRAGMATAKVPAPHIEVRREADRLRLIVELDLAPELGLLADLDWQLGLSAVIETQDGTISHWALAHPPSAPDFHHRDCFALELPPPHSR